MEKNKKIDCKKIEKMIPKFIERKLSAYEIDVLLKHVKECQSCKEELTIQYMVTEGISKAEEENNFDLLKCLEDRLVEADKQVKNHEFIYFAFVFCLIAIICIVIFCILFIFM